MNTDKKNESDDSFSLVPTLLAIFITIVILLGGVCFVYYSFVKEGDKTTVIKDDVKKEEVTEEVQLEETSKEVSIEDDIEYIVNSYIASLDTLKSLSTLTETYSMQEYTSTLLHIRASLATQIRDEPLSKEGLALKKELKKASKHLDKTLKDMGLIDVDNPKLTEERLSENRTSITEFNQMYLTYYGKLLKHIEKD